MPTVLLTCLMYVCSFSFLMVFDGTISPLGFKILITLSLCSTGWWESNSGYWSVCVGSWHIPLLRRLSSCSCRAQPKNGLFSLISSLVNLNLLSTELICPEKACTSLALIVSQISSTYLNQWLSYLPLDVVKALLHTSSMSRLSTVGETFSFVIWACSLGGRTQGTPRTCRRDCISQLFGERGGVAQGVDASGWGLG